MPDVITKCGGWKGFWIFAHLNRAKVAPSERGGVCLQEFQFSTLAAIQQKVTRAKVGFASNMMYARGLWGGEWSRGEKVDVLGGWSKSFSCWWSSREIHHMFNSWIPLQPSLSFGLHSAQSLDFCYSSLYCMITICTLCWLNFMCSACMHQY